MSDSGNQRAIAITGMGGLGKTQLAVEFCHRYGTFYEGGVYWLQCAQPDTIGSQLAAFGVGLDLVADYAMLALDAQISLVREALNSAVPRLVIFDGCEDEQVLAYWRPVSGETRVIFTSRRADWPSACGVIPISLALLHRTNSVAVLLTGRSDLSADNPALSAIAEELGDLPLALHLAACFLEKFKRGSGSDPSAYLTSLRRAPILQHRSLTAGGWSPTGHEQHVEKTFAVALEQLDPSDELGDLARYMLRFASRLAPGSPIPRYMLAPSLEELETEQDVDLAALERQEEALLRLFDLGLLSEHESGAMMHTLVAAFADDAIDDVIDDASVSERVETYMVEHIQFLLLLKDPREVLPLSSHLSRVTEQAEKRASAKSAALRLALGEIYYEAGDYSEAAKQFALSDQNALADDQQDSGGRAQAVSGLARVARILGDRDRAIELYTQASAFLETSGSDARGTQVLKFNLANALGESAPNEAQRLLEELLVSTERDIAATAFDSFERQQAYVFRVRTLTALGDALQAKDRMRARGVLREALVLTLSLEGPRSLNSWHPLSIIAAIDAAAGKHEGALEGYLEAITIVKERQGQGSSLLGDPLIGLGVVLAGAKQYEQACRVLEEALAITERCVGWKYPGVRQAAIYLAMSYIECRQYKLARRLMAKEIEFLGTAPDSIMYQAHAFQTLIIACLADGDRKAAKRHRTRIQQMLKKHERDFKKEQQVPSSDLPDPLLWEK
ncbi:tetratricopeptide repeat protein [Sphingomonas aurantiaca]